MAWTGVGTDKTGKAEKRTSEDQPIRWYQRMPFTTPGSGGPYDHPRVGLEID